MKKGLTLAGQALDTPFLLAPLAGFTDAPFRRICKRHGAALVYTEMVSGKALWYKDKNTEKLLKLYEDEFPAAYQLFGSEPDIMAYAAGFLAEREGAFIDVNMGCPVPKVVKNGEGSALMKTPELAAKIVSEMVRRSKKPITVKMRAGWDEQSICAPELAKRLEDAGAAAIAVHGRTRNQFYSGHADWSVISKVKQAVKIPVIGNGDVFSGEDAMRMISETGCDFVMIARGALGNPWIFAEANALWRGEKPPSLPQEHDKINMIKEHFSMLREEKGDYVAIREMRKQAGWYLKGMKGAAAMRRQINTVTEADEFFEVLKIK